MKAKAISFLLGAFLAAGGTVALDVYAAPGDAIYRTGGSQNCITAAQAACYADCAIADGSWDGVRSNLISVQAQRGQCDERNFWATATGLKNAPLANVPFGSVVEGVVE